MPIRSRLAPARPQKRKRFHRMILLTLLTLIILALIIAFQLFRFIVKPNVVTPGNEPVSMIIPTGSAYEDVKSRLYSMGCIMNRRSFEWVAERKNYPALVKPGHYLLSPDMSNNELVNMLRSGAQTPVRVTFNNIRTLNDLAGKVSRQVEADSLSLIRCWGDASFLKSLQTSPGKVIMIFIPNTYEFWWTTDAYEFTTRMHKESGIFWDENRKQKARSAGLSIEDAIILASIIEKETQMDDEKAVIAGVYINRLRKGWPLQADPTVVFATGDFAMKRVLTIHTQIDSPYNTYKYRGLPPGPICMPSVSSIDAVLNYKKHDYMFFCAKADFSGYHAFSRTLAEHNRYAKAYQSALNKRSIQ